MKRALITIAAIGILAPAAWVAGANAQYGSPPPSYGPAPAYGPSQAYNPSQRYTRRAYRRSAGQPSGGGLVYTPGSGPPPYDVPRQATAQGPWEWHAGPGPSKRGAMCVTHTDIGRGYGYQEPCPPPKKTAGR
jgi:hypothetical protein